MEEFYMAFILWNIGKSQTLLFIQVKWKYENKFENAKSALISGINFVVISATNSSNILKFMSVILKQSK